MATSFSHGLIVATALVVLVVFGVIIGCANSASIQTLVSPTPTPTPSIIPIPTLGTDIALQPSSSLQLFNNTSQTSLQVSLQLPNVSVSPVPGWTKLSGEGVLGAEVFGDNTKNPPNYQLVTLGPQEQIIVQLPDDPAPWRVTPFSGSQGGMPTLVECNKDIVCDGSGVDGVNYTMGMELTVVGGVSGINFNKSPCETKGLGCVNPAVDGTFVSGKNPASPNCPFGTCNLTGASLAYCDNLHFGQCANSTSEWTLGQRASTCETTPAQYTIYCYSHDDANSSPVLAAPYCVKLIYGDL